MPTIPEVTPKISPQSNPKDTTPAVCDTPSRVMTRRSARLADKSQSTVLSSPNMEKTTYTIVCNIPIYIYHQKAQNPKTGQS